MRTIKKFISVSNGMTMVYLLLFFLLIPLLLPDNLNIKANGLLFQEKKEISGKIIDQNNNQPLPGVTILVKGTSTGTVTDIDGNFKLTAASNDVLVINYVGYSTQEIPVKDQTSIEVILAEDIIGLDEVVVTGYGVQKKSDLTGSIASVSGDNLTQIPVAGVDQALQGRAAGVNVISKSGRPGENSAIQIRGISSINGVDPLVILDGMPANSTVLSSLNSSDIESIEVLKDASSAAIYGATGGNGVILITSKKGKAGKMVANFNFYRGTEKATSKVDLMNTQEWLQFYEEDSKSTVAVTSRPDTFPTYDWQSYIFKPALSENYDISFQGGSEKANYLVSASYNNQEGIIRNSDYNRYTFRLNSEQQVLKRLQIDQKIFYINTTKNGFSDETYHQYYNGPIRPCFQMAPYVPDYLPNGDWANSGDFATRYGINSTGVNPLAIIDMIDRKEKNNMFEANIGAKLDIIKGLTFTSRIDGRIDLYETKEFRDAYFNTVEDKREIEEIKLLQEVKKTITFTAQEVLNYNFSLAAFHNFNIMLGMEAYNKDEYNLKGERNKMPSSDENLLYFVVSADKTSANQIIDGTGDKETALAYFGRINYDYKQKYLLSASLRRDGRSTFGPEKRIGYFPSISLGWKFSEEPFMKNQSLISFGKLRYGYGETGSYAKSGFPYLSLIRTPDHFGYAFDGTTAAIGAAPVQIENKEISWETVKTQNLGFDLAFLNNKFTLSAEYYSKINDGMLMLKDVSYVAGTFTMGEPIDGDNTRPEVNFGSIKNSGLEFTVGYRKMEGDLKGSFDLNFSTLKNEILELASDSMTGGAVHSIAPINMTKIGASVSEFYGYQTDGMFTADDPRNADGICTNQPFTLKTNGDTVLALPKAKPGDARYKDLNGDGKINDADRTSLGSPLPKFVFGFSVNLEYKNFDFSAVFNGKIGNKLFNGMKQYLYYYQGTTNHGKDYANRYVENDIVKSDPISGEPVVVVKANHNTDIFRNNSENYKRCSDFYIEDASYLRLRNITLGYTIPYKYTQKVNIDKFRIYIGARNLLTLTKYSGMDPESGYYSEIKEMGIDIGVYPITKMYLFGVNITF